MPQNRSTPQSKTKTRNRKGNSLEGLSVPPGFEDQLKAAAKEAAGKPLSMEPDSPLGRMIGLFVEHALKEELNEHLGYPANERSDAEDQPRRRNTRNGYSPKTLKTSMGSTGINVPRDRAGEFEPKLLPKHRTMSAEIEQRVLAMYAQGMTTRDIARHVRELYHFEASENFVSSFVERIEPELVAWRNRPLEALWAIIYVDAMHVKVRHSNGVASTAVYIVSGYAESGLHEVLGLWIAPSSHSEGHGESASYWHVVLEELRKRGVRDLLFAASDALTGLAEALGLAFPTAQHIPCIVHQMRQSLAAVAAKDRKRIASELKQIYQAPSFEAAEQVLAEFAERHGDRQRRVILQWQQLLPRLSVLWTLSSGLRTMVYTTNPLENIHRQARKVTKNRAVLPSIDSALRLLTLVLMQIDRRASERNPRPDWTPIVNELHLKFADRLPPNWGLR